MAYWPCAISYTSIVMENLERTLEISSICYHLHHNEPPLDNIESDIYKELATNRHLTKTPLTRYNTCFRYSSGKWSRAIFKHYIYMSEVWRCRCEDMESDSDDDDDTTNNKPSNIYIYITKNMKREENHFKANNRAADI